MATTTNPFEPPRTANLDGDGEDASHAPPVPDEALQELIAGAAWVRWSARMTSVSIAVGLIVALVDVLRTAIPNIKLLVLFSAAVGTAVSTTLLVFLRRCAAASDRLRAGTGSVGAVVDTQASFLKLLGVLAIVALALTVLSVGAGFVIGRLGVLR